MTSKYLAIGAIALLCASCTSNNNNSDLDSAIPVIELGDAVPKIDFAQTPRKSTDKLYPVEIGEKYGYIDVTGKVVIAPQWQYAEEFRDGLALVSNDWGNHDDQGMMVSFINSSGKVAISDTLVDDIGQQGFSEGLAPFMENGRVGFIDKSGNIVIRPKFWCEPGDGDCGCACEDGAVGEFKNGVAWAKLGHTEILIDRTGKQLLKGENARNASRRHIEGLAPFKQGKLYGYKDSAGKVVIPAKYAFAGEFSEGIASVTPEGLEHQYNYIDKAGKQISDRVFDYTNDFSEGFGTASFGSRYVIVSKRGEIIQLPPHAEPSYPYSVRNGLLMATITANDSHQDVFFDQNGKIVAEFEISPPGAFRDRIATPFDGYLAEIYCQDENSLRWVDRNGKTVWSSKIASK